MTLRAWLRPEHRHTFSLAIHEEANGTWGYSLAIEGNQIYSIACVNDYDKRQTRDDFRAQQHRMELENYFLAFQTDNRNPSSLIDRNFFIQQGNTGDCDVLAVMIGILSDPSAHPQIESMVRITEDGELCLTFAPDLDQAISHHDNKTLRDIVRDQNERTALAKKGYRIEIEGTALRVTISRTRIQYIIDYNQLGLPIKSATTNCVLVNLIEHIIGNLLKHNDARPRARRNSIFAYETRKNCAEDLTANLFGYANVNDEYKNLYTVKMGEILPKAKKELMAILQNFDHAQLALSYQKRKGFVIVSYAYKDPDKDEKLSEIHALILNKIIYSKTNKIIGIELINPWDTRTPERLSLDEGIAWAIGFQVYRPQVRQAPSTFFSFWRLLWA